MARSYGVLVSCFGSIWRLSKRNYRRFLQDVAEGKDWDPADYGKMLGGQYQNVTDLDPDYARELLETL